jgi:hypothetical protein
MSEFDIDAHDLSRLANRIGTEPDTVTLLVAEALEQSYVSANVIEQSIIPHLPPQRRGFATDMLRRMDGMSMFEDRFLRDLEALIAILDDHVEAGTEVYWHHDEHHIDGGYAVIQRSDAAESLRQGSRVMATLRDKVLAAMSGARAVREAARLLDR